MYTRACKVAVLAALVCALLLALPECEANTNRALSRAMSRRSGGASQPRVQRSEGVSQPRVQRSEGVSQPRVQRSEGVSQPRVQRSEGVSQPRVQRSEGVSQPRVQRSEDVSQPRVQRSDDYRGSTQSIQDPKRLTKEECETKGRSLLSSISSDSDILSCAASVSDKCCRAVRRQLGKGGPLYGCNCHGGFVQEAVQQAPEFVRGIVREALSGCSVSC